MALLEKPKLKDHLDRLGAFLLTLLCVGLGLLAAHQVRLAAALAGELAQFDYRAFRLMNIVVLLVLGLLWFVYVLWTVDSHQRAYRRARVLRSQGIPMPVAYTQHRIMQWLWEHNLHLVVDRVRRDAVIPLGVLLVARIVRAVLQALLLG